MLGIGSVATAGLVMYLEWKYADLPGAVPRLFRSLVEDRERDGDGDGIEGEKEGGDLVGGV